MRPCSLRSHASALVLCLLGIVPACLLTAPSEDETTGGCAADEKQCGNRCVSLADPAYGCASDSCSACEVKHATAICVAGQCANGQCMPGYDDCNHLPADGCEAELWNDPANCTKCQNGCASGLCSDAGCCKQLGESCGGQAECCGNECNGKCCVRQGGACTQPSDCCDGVCTDFLCCRGSGMTCGEDEDCCSDKCGSGGLCQ